MCLDRASGLVADFVVDVVVTAGLIDDLAGVGRLAADELRILERQVLGPFDLADVLLVVFGSNGLRAQTPSA